MSTVQEIEAALDRLPPEQLRQVGDWIAARLMPETTTAMLVALDAGIWSQLNEPAVPVDEVRRKIKEWSTV